jgi:hypothetical protein
MRKGKNEENEEKKDLVKMLQNCKLTLLCFYPLIGARVPAYMRVNGRIWCTNYRWLCYGQY